MAEKVYYPETIDSNPLPGQTEAIDINAKDPGSSGQYEQTEIRGQNFPDPRIAHETIGASLNTKSRKILGKYGFTESGSIQIGKVLSGVNGDIRISPDGIIARNSSGVNTFVLDGDSGDATFAGTIQSGALITGKVIVGNNTWVIDGDSDKPKILLYVDNIPSIVLGVVV